MSARASSSTTRRRAYSESRQRRSSPTRRSHRAQAFQVTTISAADLEPAPVVAADAKRQQVWPHSTPPAHRRRSLSPTRLPGASASSNAGPETALPVGTPSRSPRSTWARLEDALALLLLGESGRVCVTGDGRHLGVLTTGGIHHALRRSVPESEPRRRRKPVQQGAREEYRKRADWLAGSPPPTRLHGEGGTAHERNRLVVPRPESEVGLRSLRPSVIAHDNLAPTKPCSLVSRHLATFRRCVH